jgi:DNA topoisomerase-3
MKKLVLAEKPSVGRDIARVLKANRKGNGFIEGKDYVVTWALGHLVTLKEPGDYDKKWKHWSLASLPIMPEKMKLKVLKTASKQFRAVKPLLKRNDIEEVIIATDAGREGELVARWILLLAGWKKKVKRLWISSQTDEAIRDGFANLHDGKKYLPLFDAAVCRAEADWLIGLNVTRALTCKYDTQLSAGRVQTPTLSMIVEREKQIQNFEPKKFWKIQVHTEKGKAVYTENNSEKSFFNQAKADEIFSKIKPAKTAKVLSVTSKKHKEYAPLPYDLTELQRDANKLFGYSAKDTLRYMQTLYERHKVLTYPRTDSRYLTKDIIGTLPSRLQHLQNSSFSNMLKGLNIKAPEIFSKMINDKKVSDHHAIIPTELKADFSKMTSEEKKIYSIVTERFIAQFYPVHQYEKVTAFLEISGLKFKITGKTILESGWKKLHRDAEEEQVLSKFTTGQSLKITRSDLIQSETQPPKRYTEATLLTAMESAGKFIEDEKLRDEIKDSGLGTPATRADIIEKLIQSFYIERQGKSLHPTSKGTQLIEIVPEQLRSPELTAKWETRLSKIAKNEARKNDFLSDIRKNAISLVSDVKTSCKEFKFDFSSGVECPICGKPMLKRNGKKGKATFQCSDRRCGYEQTGEKQENLRERPKTKKQRRIDSTLLKQYGKSKKSTDQDETLGDLFSNILG